MTTPPADTVLSCAPESCGCPSQKMVLSLEEEAVLSRMRRLKLIWRDLQQKRLNSLNLLEKESIDRQIDELRARFETLKLDLAVANHEKLRRLGHEP